MSGTPVYLSHSIRLRPGAHTGAECVLTEPLIRATAKGERETAEGQKGRTERVTDKKQQGHSKGDITKTKKNKKGEGWGES